MSSSIFGRLGFMIAKNSARRRHDNVFNYIPALWASNDAATNVQPSLFSESRLKLNLYKKRRSTIYHSKLNEVRHTFMSQIEQHLEAATTNTVTSDDLDWILHTASDNKELHMALRMFKRYEMYRSNVVNPDFRYDVIFMRLCHTLNNPDVAFLAFKEQTDSFRTNNGFIVLMDLLFINSRYSELYEVYETALTKFTKDDSSVHLPWMMLYLAVSACYFQGTSTSYSRMKNILAEPTKFVPLPGSRTMALAAHFALKQNEPLLALDYLKSVNLTNTVLASLKVQTYVMLEQPDAAIDVLINLHSDSEHQPHIIQESLDSLVKSVEASNNTELKSRLSAIVKKLQEDGLIKNIPLHNYLTRQISVPTNQLPAVFKKAKGDTPNVMNSVKRETSDERATGMH